MPILTYPELKGVQRIEQILGPTGKAVLLFLTTGLSEGHWVGIFERSAQLCFFDSYGLAPDAHRSWLSHDKQVELHEDVPLLHHLFKEAEDRGLTPGYSTTCFQNPHDDSETCGRHVAVRLRHADLSDAEYMRYLKKAAETSGASTADQAVLNITYPILHK